MRLLRAILIGAAVGLAVGYSDFKLSGGMLDFVYWISPTRLIGPRAGALVWIFIGMIVAGAVSCFWPRKSN